MNSALKDNPLILNSETKLDKQGQYAACINRKLINGLLIEYKVYNCCTTSINIVFFKYY